MTATIPQDKDEVLIRVTPHGYSVLQIMSVTLTAPFAQNGERAEHIIPNTFTEFLLPDIDALLDWLADHLAIPRAHMTMNTQ